jgi:hypothetical protein
MYQTTPVLVGPEGASEEMLDSVAKQLTSKWDPTSFDIAAAMSAFSPEDQNRLAVKLLARGMNPEMVSEGIKRARGITGHSEEMWPGFWASRTPEQKNKIKIWGVLATISMAASAYHGYKRNDSIGWAIGWAICGSLFPVITPVIAVAQGFGKPKGR